MCGLQRGGQAHYKTQWIAKKVSIALDLEVPLRVYLLVANRLIAIKVKQFSFGIIEKHLIELYSFQVSV